jgi:hypothetical protein
MNINVPSAQPRYCGTIPQLPDKALQRREVANAVFSLLSCLMHKAITMRCRGRKLVYRTLVNGNIYS